MVIFLVEDNNADVFLFREALKLHGIDAELRVVQDGETAVEWISNLDSSNEICPALFLLDINLPKKTGREVLAHIRNSTRCAEIPVIVVTSSDAEVDRLETQRLGANAFFKKPSHYDQFLRVGEIVKQMLDKTHGPVS